MESRLIKIYNEEINKNIFLRRGIKSDMVCYKDVFEGKYHVIDLDPEPKTVLDLGSNIGLTALHYRRIWPKAQIVGLEMDSDNFNVAVENLQDEDVLLINYAVSDSSGRIYYDKKRDSQQCYRISKVQTKKSIQGYSMSLDMALDYLNIGGVVDFVKMDIEGTELDIISGSGAWGSRIRNLLVEVHGKTDEETPKNVKKIKKMLEDKEFNVKRHKIHWSALHAWKTI